MRDEWLNANSRRDEVFFFSSRRRHTRFDCDWSSDVCSSDLLKAQSELDYLRETGSANVPAKKQEKQDWIVLWVFNHFFSAAEAFVSAHLQDFPKDLKVQAFPGGVGISVPVPHP